MAPFINENFLLQTKAAQKLYHDYARDLPIIDYHCHLPPDEIQKDVQFENLARIWLSGDHYKWRAMRTCGVPERLVTGDASDEEKFHEWASTVPLTLKNPLFHWTHLELKRYFGIDELLNEDTASEIWNETKDKLARPELSVRSILESMKVEVVCTTDDPADSLEEHTRYQKESGTSCAMFPTFRPDKAMQVEQGEVYRNYISSLGQAAGMSINSYDDLLQALKIRHDFFDEKGCRASDHGIEQPYAAPYTESQLKKTFEQALAGKKVGEEDALAFKSALMHEFALMDHEKGWAFQIHVGGMRNNNTRMFNKLGPDTGFDSIGDFEMARPLSRFMDRLDQENKLPRTILYNLNSADNPLFATMIGNFQDGSVPGKIQHGPAWWFHDQKEGMEDHLQTLSNMGCLSQFVGMVTDSRSFLSFPRHEYYRRTLCNMLGNDIEEGIIPDDDTMMKELIQRVCYTNALDYFQYSGLPENAEYAPG